MDEHNGREPSAKGEQNAAVRLLRIAGRRPEIPRDREQRIYASVRAHWLNGLAAQRRQSWWWVAAPLAAAALVIMAVAIPLLRPTAEVTQVAVVEVVAGEAEAVDHSLRVPLSVGAKVNAGALIETGRQGLATLRLAGGASLRIDAASRVVLAEPATLRLDRGTVYIDSGRERVASSVTVACAFAEVRDIGTQFEVRALGDGLRVRVREGTVVLRGSRQDEEIAAGTEATLGAGGALSVRPFSPSDPEWSWVLAAAPPFELEGRTASDFLRWAARETGLELRWATPKVAAVAEKTILHGDIRGLRPDEAPAAVLPTCGLDAKVEGGGLLVEASAR